jgi:hypothetical protein
VLRVISDLHFEEDKSDAIIGGGRALKQDRNVPATAFAKVFSAIPIPGGRKLLLCNSFCQAAHRSGLGDDGSVQPGIKTEDTTPGDLWYRNKGTRWVPSE